MSSSQLNKLPALLQNIKNLKMEKEKLQELVQALKDSHLTSEQSYEKKLAQKSAKIQKFASQCSHLMLEKQALESTLRDLKKNSQLKDQIDRLEQHYTQEAQK